MTIERDAIWHAVYAAAYVTFLDKRTQEISLDNDDFDPLAHEKARACAHYDAECCADDNAETRSKIAHYDAARKAGRP